MLAAQPWNSEKKTRKCEKDKKKAAGTIGPGYAARAGYRANERCEKMGQHREGERERREGEGGRRDGVWW